MTKRIARDSAWAGHCLCGQHIEVLRSFTKERPLECACGRRWYVDAGIARFDHSPLDPLKMGGAAIRTEEAMRELAAILKARLPKTMGFTVFVFDWEQGGSVSYLSTADREDSTALIREWLKKASP